MEIKTITELLNNIVIKNTSFRLGKQIISFYKSLGINTTNHQGTCIVGDSLFYYYGIINNKFDNRSWDSIKTCKVLTLDEVKTLVEDYQAGNSVNNTSAINNEIWC